MKTEASYRASPFKMEIWMSIILLKFNKYLSRQGEEIGDRVEISAEE